MIRSIEYMLIAEAGILERQALLLCESIRLYAGQHADWPITVISPRPERRPSQRFIESIGLLDIQYLPLDIESPCPEYGPSFRVMAAAIFENRSTADTLVVLDSDTIFIRQPDLDLAGADAAVRPVGVKGMCTSGKMDPMDAYWQSLCRLCDVDYDCLPYVCTTIDRQLVKASYNGGFVVARRDAKIFQRTEDYFLRSVAAGLKPFAGSGLIIRAGHGEVSGPGSEYWGSSQACLSLAMWGSGLSVRTLPATHNCPLRLYEQMHLSASESIFNNLVHLHYHDVFSKTGSENPVANGRMPLPRDVSDWLLARMPFTLNSQAS